ncbi:MAG TPA: hypothetical protein V6C72_16195 [Chroococcales cyanobacterium]
MPNDDQAAAKKIKELFNQLSVSQKEDIQQFVNGSLVKRADIERLENALSELQKQKR